MAPTIAPHAAPPMPHATLPMYVIATEPAGACIVISPRIGKYVRRGHWPQSHAAYANAPPISAQHAITYARIHLGMALLAARAGQLERGLAVVTRDARRLR